MDLKKYYVPKKITIILCILWSIIIFFITPFFCAQGFPYQKLPYSNCFYEPQIGTFVVGLLIIYFLTNIILIIWKRFHK